MLMMSKTCLVIHVYYLSEGASVFRWVWLYKITTEDSIHKKACAICDGSTRGGPAPVSGHTYAPTPDMTDLRLCFALSVLEHKLISRADVSYLFAEASAPPQIYNMRVATQFREWWAANGRPPIPQGRVIPILMNLQGHPEAPQKWSHHIDTLLQKYHYELTVHALCLYRATINGEDGPFLSQVDVFALATNNDSVYTKIYNDLDAALPVPIKRQGLLTHYHGIDIIQTRHYITLHVGSYIHIMLARWLSKFVLSLTTFMLHALPLLSFTTTNVELFSWPALLTLPRSLASLILSLHVMSTISPVGYLLHTSILFPISPSIV